jgi:hypothetical protein
MVLEQKIVGKHLLQSRQSLQATILDSTIENSNHKFTNFISNALELLFYAKIGKISSALAKPFLCFIKTIYGFKKYYMDI